MKKIFSDKFSSVYFFEEIDQPNHSSEGMTKAALRDYIGGYPLNCKEPIQLHWNRSDTSTYCVVAVGIQPVGIDIEYMRERPFERLSKRYFHEWEHTDDKEIFYDLWTRKEAYTKWKKGKIANYMNQIISKDMVVLLELPDGIKGHLCRGLTTVSIP